ncbi:MAG: hypothetical protein ABFS86_05690 [Planctomycetota bacterium]
MDRLRNKPVLPPARARFEGPGCVDAEVGRRLIPYSLGRLSPEQEFDFEVHLIECDHCFDALRGLDQIESLVRACIDSDPVDES